MAPTRWRAPRRCGIAVRVAGREWPDRGRGQQGRGRHRGPGTAAGTSRAARGAECRNCGPESDDERAGRRTREPGGPGRPRRSGRPSGRCAGRGRRARATRTDRAAARSPPGRTGGRWPRSADRRPAGARAIRAGEPAAPRSGRAERRCWRRARPGPDGWAAVHPSRAAPRTSSSSPTSSVGPAAAQLRLHGQVGRADGELPDRVGEKSPPVLHRVVEPHTALGERQRHDVGQRQRSAELPGGRCRLRHHRIVIREITHGRDDRPGPRWIVRMGDEDAGSGQRHDHLDPFQRVRGRAHLHAAVRVPTPALHPGRHRAIPAHHGQRLPSTEQGRVQHVVRFHVVRIGYVPDRRQGRQSRFLRDRPSGRWSVPVRPRVSYPSTVGDPP